MTKTKVVLFVLCILSMLLLASSIGSLVQIQELKNELQEQQAQINELQPTQSQRYLNLILEEKLLENVQFIELDTTMTDTIEAQDYSVYIIELTETTMVEISIAFKNNFLEWYDESVDLNIYYGGVTEPDISYENLQKTITYTLALQKGFNAIELSSYSNSTWEYTITIREKN